MRVKLQHVAHVRSGDKGNTSNVMVIAYSDDLYPLIKAQLTAEAFKRFYRGVVNGAVERYEVDNIAALNFVAHDALGGGVSRSLCLDNYGKALSSAILAYEIEVPERLANRLRGL
jgi:hypothetical protein